MEKRNENRFMVYIKKIKLKKKQEKNDRKGIREVEKGNAWNKREGREEEERKKSKGR